MVITAHFIDDSWTLQSQIIRFIYVPCLHTAETLSDVLMECLLDWNLDRNLSTLTVDNYTTNDKMIDLILAKLSSSSLLLGGGFFHMRCCAHILNLIVKDGLEVIGGGVERILMYGQYASNEIDKIRKYCYDLVKECGSNHISNMGHQPSFTSSQLNQSDFEEMNPLTDNFDLFVSSTVSTDNVKSELDHYLDEAVLPRTSYFDILGWWKSNGTKYHILSDLARDILAIPVSTVASELAFSTSGRFVSPHRSRLHPKTLEALMCAQNWLWKEIPGTPKY